MAPGTEERERRRGVEVAASTETGRGFEKGPLSSSSNFSHKSPTPVHLSMNRMQDRALSFHRRMRKKGIVRDSTVFQRGTGEQRDR